jgi:TolB-like protein/DNA-binding winged helix-turn-helix (wHTH) protein
MSRTDQQKPSYQFGEFALDTARGALLRNRDEVVLRPQSVQVLRVLLEHPGQLVTKDELHDQVWGQKAVTDDSLAHCIADIRKALGDSERKLLRTLPRRGYLFDGQVTVVQPGNDIPSADSPHRVRNAAVIAGVSLAAWLGWSFWAAPAQAPSIAVLPMINISAVPENRFFGEGVHEEILTNLSRVEDLRVVSRTTMSQYLNSSHSVRDIGRELDVQYVVEGSVRRIDNHVRITVQLVDALEDSHLWARNYDRELIDILGTQSAVGRDISNSIQLEIMPDSVGTLSRMPTESVKAYDLFITADSIHRGEPISEDNYRRQRELLEAAVAEDPDFAQAWARLNDHLDEIARTIVQDDWFGETREERDAYFAQTREAAKRALDRAVALDPDSAATLLALGTDAIAEFNDHQFRVERKKYLDQALELEPDNGWIWYALGWWGWDAGKLQEGTEAILKALELDPLHAHIVGGSLTYFTLIGDREMVARLTDRLAVIAPEPTGDMFGAEMPSEVKLANLYGLFLYTGEEAVIEALAEAHADETENYITIEGLSDTLEYWKIQLLTLQNDVGALAEFELPKAPDDPTFEQALRFMIIHNRVLSAQARSGHSEAAAETAQRVLEFSSRLDVDQTTPEGMTMEIATLPASLALEDDGRIRDLRKFLRGKHGELEESWNPWVYIAYSLVDLDSAVEMVLDKTQERPGWGATDVIAANQLVTSDFLLHPEMQAFYAAEGKWINYLAARVTTYAQYLP